MDVTTTHHIDASDPDTRGMHDYYYEYDVYRFSAGEIALIARSYIDTPVEAHFLRIELRGEGRLLCDADLKMPLFADAVAYLRAAGKHEIRWLSGRGDSYELLPNPSP